MKTRLTVIVESRVETESIIVDLCIEIAPKSYGTFINMVFKVIG